MINEYLHQLLHVSKSVWYVLLGIESAWGNLYKQNHGKPTVTFLELSNQVYSLNNFPSENNMTSRNLSYRNVTNVHLTVISDVQNEDVCYILH